MDLQVAESSEGPPQPPGLIPQSSFTHHTVYFLHPSFPLCVPYAIG